MLTRRSLGKQAAAGAAAALGMVGAAEAAMATSGQVSGVSGGVIRAPQPYLDAYGNELPRNADGTTLTYVDVSGIVGQVGERVKLDNDHREYTVMTIYSERFPGLDGEYWRTGLKPVASI